MDILLLNNQETRKLQPFLSKNIIGSTFSKLDAHINPILFTLTLAEEAKRLGAKISLYNRFVDNYWLLNKYLS